MGRIKDKMWELYNKYSTLKNVLIISREDFKREIERIEIQLDGLKLSQECEHEWENYCTTTACNLPNCQHTGRLCKKCKIDKLLKNLGGKK